MGEFIEIGALINKTQSKGGAYSKEGAYWKESAKSNHYSISTESGHWKSSFYFKIILCEKHYANYHWGKLYFILSIYETLCSVLFWQIIWAS